MMKLVRWLIKMLRAAMHAMLRMNLCKNFLEKNEQEYLECIRILLEHLGIINPIYNEPSCYEADCHAHHEEQTVLGVLDISVTLEEVDKLESTTSRNMILFAILATLLIALILRLAVRNLIQKPIRGLVKATDYVAIGNLNHRIDSTRKDELGVLAKSFDNMTKKLSEMRLQLFQSDKLASLGKLSSRCCS